MTAANPIQVTRERVLVTGTVQGVGFRPTVCRLARAVGLGGWVRNTAGGATLELEGAPAEVERFLRELPDALPAGAALRELQRARVDPVGEREFRIEPSAAEGQSGGALEADSVTCAACLRETRDPRDRRYRYPFVACAACGPRFSIARELPWDRERTTLASFPLCVVCANEYTDPADRRFHAQATGCPACGPRLRLEQGGVVLEGDAALRAAAEVLRAGGLLALKGLGGYQLLADARAPAAVRRLRAFKARPHEPLAVMVGDLEAAQVLGEVGPEEAQLLTSAAGPIVLLTPRGGGVCAEVAPDSPSLGVMLPTTALHALLLDALECPLVVTSGNRSGSPMVTDDARARAQLAPGVDALLGHDRAIAACVDDSLAQVVGGEPQLLRRARGYVPRPLGLGCELPPLLATGGQLKATLAVVRGREVELSQHLGDLDDLEAWQAWERARERVVARRQLTPRAVACDLNPAYRSTRLGDVRVQHHEAHVLAVLAEHGLEPPALGVAWDGAGLGHDGTVWGGEFFAIDATSIRRVAHLACFPLPGGDASAREPRRSALGLLHAAGLEPPQGWREAHFAPDELRTLSSMLARGVRSPLCSSAGRLFEGVAALLGLGSRSSYEGQAAQRLQAAAERGGAQPGYPCELTGETLRWQPLLAALLDDLAAGVALEAIAARVHAGLVDGIVRVAAREGRPQVVLGGGCFQNRLLLGGAAAQLRTAGFAVRWPQAVPPNDGGLALGQLLGAARALGEV